MVRSIVRSSCAAFMTHPACEAKTHPDLIPSFLASVDEARYREILRREAAQLSLPLKFDSPHQRLNFFAVLHLLNFGSGYRSILKAANGSGAFENIIKLLVAIHVDDDDKRIGGGTGSKLDAAWMEAVDAGAVGEWMRVDMTVERAVPENPILKQLVPSPAAEVVRLITAALNETGAALRGPLGRHADLMDFVRHCVARNSDVDGLFASLAALPVLDDAVTLDRVGAHHGGNTDGDGDSDGLKVCIYKKIQVMLSELMRNGFEIPYLQKADLTIFSDNVIPTMLRHHGLISCPSAEDALLSGAEVTGLQALSVRAASVVVCEEIVRVAATRDMAWFGTEVDLDNYLWKVAKEGDLRKLPRYADRSTWFY